MRILLKRWVVYLCLPAALVLFFAPLNVTRPEQVDRETVFLGILETLSPPKSVEEKEPVAAADTEEAVWQELKRGQAALDAQFSNDTTVTNTAGIPVVRENAFSDAPDLLEAVETQVTRLGLMSQDHLNSTRLESVPAEEWNSFQETFTDEGRFQFGNRIFEGRTKFVSVQVQAEIPHLNTGRKIAAGSCLLISLLLLPGLMARPTNGIRIGRRGAIVLWDLIIIGIGALFMWMAMDTLLHHFFGTEWWGGDEMMAGMSFFWIALATPLMALITTATASQILWITTDGVALKGLTGLQAIPWVDIQRIEISSIRGPQSATGGLPSKRVARHLIITGNADSLRILEPPMTSTKKEILQALESLAPEQLKDSIAAIAAEWSSLW